MHLILVNICGVNIIAHPHSLDWETEVVDGIPRRSVLAPGALNAHLPPALL